MVLTWKIKPKHQPNNTRQKSRNIPSSSRFEIIPIHLVITLLLLFPFDRVFGFWAPVYRGQSCYCGVPMLRLLCLKTKSGRRSVGNEFGFGNLE